MIRSINLMFHSIHFILRSIYLIGLLQILYESQYALTYFQNKTKI